MQALGCELADFAKLLQDTLTELMRLTVGSMEEQTARGVPRELRLEPYRLEYFCVRAVGNHGEQVAPDEIRSSLHFHAQLGVFPLQGAETGATLLPCQL